MIKLSKSVLEVIDIPTYVDLLNSVAQQGLGSKRKRPLAPVRCANLINKLKNELTGKTLEDISVMLQLGKPKDMSKLYQKRDTSQLSMFLNLLKVSGKSRELAGWSTDDYPYIPFSTIAQLAPLTDHEQDIIIQSIHKSKDKKHRLGKEDVKKIKIWRKENPDQSINECIEKILKLKPIIVITNMIVAEISDQMRRFLESNGNDSQALLRILHEKLEGEFHEIDIGNSVMAISMDEEAYKIFYDHQYNKNISYTKFLESILETKNE